MLFLLQTFQRLPPRYTRKTLAARLSRSLVATPSDVKRYAQPLPNLRHLPLGFVYVWRDNLNTHAADLNKAAASGDLKAATAAFGAMGKNVCKACHDDYRQKS